ncbi:FAD-dependent oxidoreductase [Streptomyces hirsutus]|uniref:FAD-dependent oxidoreductase n=1 Tax=Streptomyces hirsutus TaxID=35620 RepID=UPI0036AE2853
MAGPESRPHVLVIGGGIGGFTTALACARRGMSVHVLERAPEIKEIGAGLQLGPNAGRLLGELGVLDSVLRTAVLPERFVILDAYTGREIYQARFGQALAERFGAPYTVMHRADLLDTLLQGSLATGLVTAFTGKEVVGVEQDARGATVTCADGSTHSADVVIGADGLRSAVRREVLDDSEPAVSRYAIYRGPGPRPEGVEDAVTLYAGDGLHLMQYPIQGGELLNRVASFRSDRGAPGSDTWAPPEELFERFADTCDPVREALHHLDLGKRWEQFDRKPMPGWAQGRVALLGDAAHPMRQYLAQGAGQAMEDAVALAAALADSPDDPVTALKEYEEIRFPRAAAVQRNTRFFGEMVHLGGVGAVLRDFAFSSLTADDYSLAEWLYGTGGAPAPQPPARLDFYTEGR